MSSGKDVSQMFASVVKNVVSKNPEVSVSRCVGMLMMMMITYIKILLIFLPRSRSWCTYIWFDMQKNSKTWPCFLSVPFKKLSRYEHILFNFSSTVKGLLLRRCVVLFIGSKPVNPSKCLACAVEYSGLDHCANYDASH